ncbi:MAG: hypothetical protein ACRC33_29965 [Gemmataceae bacterium]
MNRSRSGAMAVLLTATLALGQPPKSAESQEVVKQVFAAWKARRARVKSVRYEVSGEVIVAKGSNTIGDDGFTPLKVPLPPRDVSTPQSATLLLDFEGQRFAHDQRKSLWHPDKPSPQRQVTRTTYDGKERWMAWPPGESGRPPSAPDVTVATGNLRMAAFTPRDWPMFIAHGYVPTNQTRILPGRFLPKVNENEFYLHGRGKHAGRDCVVLRTEVDHLTGKGFTEYWVDVARGGAVLRCTIYSGGFTPFDLELRYQDLPGDGQLAGWTYTVRNGKQTLSIYRLRVDACVPDVPVEASDFTVTIRPGMSLVRKHLGGHEDSIAPPTTVSEQRYRVTSRDGRTSFGWAWWAAVGAVLVLSSLAVWRWRAGSRRGR